MADYIQLDVVTPERELLSRSVLEIVAPGSAGEFGVLPGHTPFLTTLKPGEVMARTEDRDLYMAIGGGFAEVTATHIILLAETAELADDIDLEKANEALELAQKKINEIGKEHEDYPKWAKRLTKAETRVKVAERITGGS